MIPYSVVLVILIMHYIADFCWQTHWQASNKSKSNKALLAHVTSYTLGLLIAGSLILPGWNILIWVAYNAIAHFCVDYVTSRASSKRWAKQEWHDFFSTVGFDQLIHYFTLFTSYITLT